MGSVEEMSMETEMFISMTETTSGRFEICAVVLSCFLLVEFIVFFKLLLLSLLHLYIHFLYIFKYIKNMNNNVDLRILFQLKILIYYN